MDADSGSCLVFNRPSRECQVSVRDFNRRVPGFIAPAGPGAIPNLAPENVNAIRNRILDSFLEEAFRERPGNPYRTVAGKDTPDQTDATALPAGIDSNLIARIFREDWVSLVRIQNRISFEIYASTDSGLIDSLGKGTKRSGNWTPAHFSARDAAEEWIRKSPALIPGKWGPPIKTAFGYVVLKINRKPPTSREALPLLIEYAYLRLNTPARKWDSLSLAYHAKHLTGFDPKPILRISARLLPRPKGIFGRSLGAKRNRDDSILNLAAFGYPVKNLTSLDLPPSARAYLDSAYLQDPDAPLEPFLSEYGYWWINIAGTKSAAGNAPTKAVLEDIEMKLRRTEADSLMAVSAESIDSKKRERDLATEEAAWRLDLERKLSPEERMGDGDSLDATETIRRIVDGKMRKAKAEWIAANLEIRADFR